MTNFTVTTLADENDAGASEAVPGGDGLSLREALALANADAVADTITFDPSLGDGILTLVNDELVISTDFTIDGDVNGDDKADILIDADGVFHVTAGTSTLRALNITGRSALASVRPAPAPASMSCQGPTSRCPTARWPVITLPVTGAELPSMASSPWSLPRSPRTPPMATVEDFIITASRP